MSSPTLLSFLDAPVVVGDPDGRAAYVNPAFEAVFSTPAEEAMGRPLAILFEGGVREALLRAVADVCEEGTSARFRVRHAGVGYSGLASPIVAEDARVGFVILLVANAAEDERVHTLQREIHEPAGELLRVFDELSTQIPVQRSENARSLVEDGLRALSRLRKRSDELSAVLARKPVPPRATTFDAARLLADVTADLGKVFADAGAVFEAHIPSPLPMVRGDGARFEECFRRLLSQRAMDCGPGSAVSVRARAMDREGTPSVVVAVLDSHTELVTSAQPPEPVPDAVRRIVQELGGDLRTTAGPDSGRTTAIRLNAVKQ